MMIRDLNSRSNDELLTYYSNACKTYYGAIGHTKSHWNEHHAQHYAEALTARKQPVPSMSKAADAGQFNGTGSY